MNLLALPILESNYIWILHDDHAAIVIDPGACAPVQQALSERHLTLAAILVTHTDPDHISGLAQLHAKWPTAPVFAPAREPVLVPFTAVHEGDVVQALGLRFDVIEVPGHTIGHVAYFCASSQGGTPLLFCGDALFSGGCGYWRVGSAAMVHGSLTKLAQLPEATQVCCAHEYTLANLQFGQAVEPENADIPPYRARCLSLRARHQPTLPSTLGQEKRINPFLRCDHPAVIRSALAHGAQSSSPPDVFAALRQWKNTFQ